MGNVTQDSLYETFVQISGAQNSNQGAVTDASEQLVSSVSDAMLGTAATITQQATDAIGEVANGTSGPVAGPLVSALQDTPNPPAAASSASSTSDTAGIGSVASSLVSSLFGGMPIVGGIQSAEATSGGGIGSEVESVASTVLKSGLGMLPLISGLLGLFGGGSAPDPPALTKYAMPASLTFQGAEVGSGVGNGDYDQNGMPRGYGAPAASSSATTSGGTAMGGNGAGGSGSSPGTSPAPQITVNVQAMDARSFLDRSSDIAAAVRDAMLNLNSINDVVNDL
jgi:hypothetical protein